MRYMCLMRILRCILVLSMSLHMVGMAAYAAASGPEGTRSVLSMRAPALPRLATPQAKEAVRLTSLSIRTIIQDGFAETALEMVFFNPNTRILEGQLQFPLLPGQEISGLALDIGGVMRRGVPVEKARGLEVFEAITRRNVDPALLEATAGNVYNLRIYPLPAQGTRRVMVRVLEPLQASGGMFRYSLPLEFSAHLERFQLEVVVAAEETPHVASGNLGLTLKREGMFYTGRVEKTALTPQGRLDITIPVPAEVQRNVHAVAWGNHVYFSAVVPVPGQCAQRALPKVTTVIWDASASGQERDHAREFAVLDGYFKAMGEGEARLIVLRDTAQATQSFPVRAGDWSALRAALTALPYDGATDLTAWTPSADCAEYLLFSDGLGTWGGSLEEKPLPAPERLYTLSAATRADHAALRRAATGGFIDLLQGDSQSALATLLFAENQVSVTDVVAGMGTVLLGPSFEGGNNGMTVHHLTGRYPLARAAGETPKVRVRIAGPDGREKTAEILLPYSDKAPRHTGDEAPLAARLWARYRTVQLEAAPRLHKAELTRLGREFGIVNSRSSLIVLETARDYARYEVDPPAELRAEVEKLRASGHFAQSERWLAPEKLRALWQARVAWWEREFPSDIAPSPVKEERAAMQPEALQTLNMDTAAGPAARARPSMATSAAKPHAHGSELPTQQNASEIVLTARRSSAAHAERFRKAAPQEIYTIYLDERPSQRMAPDLYLDAADALFAAKQPELALRVLSNLAELDMGNRELLRMTAYRLMEAHAFTAALPLLERVREIASHEPQSLRDLAQVHAALGHDQEAAELLYETARRAWDRRFGEINVIALTELNALIALKSHAVDTAHMDPTLLMNLPVDLRVVLAWDTDNADMDLMVTDPHGETASYRHTATSMGGRMSRDCTAGYGPEEFMLKKAVPGEYTVTVLYYGTRRQVLSGETTLLLTLTTDFGRPEQKEQRTTMRLKQAKETVRVGTFRVR